MKPIIFMFALLLPVFAQAGAYEDMEEAMIRQDPSAIIDLLKRGVDVNTVDREGNSLLTQAVKRDLPEAVDYLMAHRARLNPRNKHGETAVSIAAYTGKLAYVKKLVEAGAEVNYYGWPPLAYAAYNGHLDIVDYLIKRGAEVNAKTGNGSTALFFASRFGHIDVVHLLLKNQADPTVENENGETAVDWALKSANTDIEAILREAGGRSGKKVVLDVAK
ncbi:MAG: ankyrin repeat domain-containing protein [Propionivibrio sp.]|jgi:ankyrin repeat protein|nr:ankyrin repeat domain-containing protein [Propionivibrio sp.]MBP6709984.1 ankyrin repeat domain-containing protein [Propionivibrio sp.]MBP7524164.1 ankyrin repeat domain-containing protein [Propionivibrio sp.]MBP8162427.1 ankyrin repeat domain-containing protein [Propionivibrio sp.]